MQTIFFSNRKYFYFRLGNQKSVSRGVEMGTFLCRRVKFQKCGLRPFECPLFNCYSSEIIFSASGSKKSILLLAGYKVNFIAP